MAKPDKQEAAFGFFLKAVSHHPVKTAGIIVGDMLQAICTLLIPFVIKDLIDAMVGYDAGAGVPLWHVVEEPFYNFVLVAFALLIASRISGVFLAFLAPVIRIVPRNRMFAHLQNHSVNFFQSSYGGALGNKINESLNGMAFGLWIFTFEVWPVLIKFCASIVLLLVSYQLMGWVMLGWVVCYFSVIAYLATFQAKRMEQIANERSRITGNVVDVASNIQTVKAFANERYEKDRMDDVMQGEVSAIQQYQLIRETAGWFHSLMSFGIMVGMIYLAISFYSAGTISVGDIAFIFSLVLLITEQSRSLIWGLTNFLEYLGQMNDGVKTVMTPHKMHDRDNAATLSAPSAEIVYDHVHFHYPEAVQQKTVLHDFNLSIPAGQKLGLIGPSGAGKSTLVNLLMRFYDVPQGKICINGQDIAHVTQESLRRAIAIIPQDTALFHRNLMENIRYGRLDASDDDVIAAAKKAHADDFIADLPEGYQTMVGERGVKLSGGQRQRIAIARAILKDAPILLLDEATSALDSESERLIQESLKHLMEGKTVIAIAHRLSTIAHLDRLIVMNNGKIVEDGVHHDLLQDGGLYAKLWSMQSGGFLRERDAA